MTETSIHDAAGAGDLARVNQLLDSDPELVNQDDVHQWRPIFHAALRKRLDIVQTLIDRGADLAAHDGYVMHYGGEVPDNKEVVELLVRYGALDAHTEPEDERARQFIYAVFLANTARVHAMLESNVDLAKVRYARGDTALHHASRNGDTAIVDALLAHGAEVNAVTKASHFPLYCAVGHGHVETAEVLLRHGADRSQRMEDGKTVSEWLQPYLEHDPRLQACMRLLS